MVKPSRGPRPGVRPETPKPDPRRVEPGDAAGPSVVVVGGGAGVIAAARAVRRYAGTIHVVAGGCTRTELRECLLALAADDGPWTRVFSETLGEIVVAALTEACADTGVALDEAGRALRTVGRVIPIEADGEIPMAALAAIRGARQIVVAPGSTYARVLATIARLAGAVGDSAARTVMVGDLAGEDVSVAGSGADELRTVLGRGLRIDAFVFDPQHGLPVDDVAVKELDVTPVPAPIAAAGGEHDVVQLANALSALL